METELQLARDVLGSDWDENGTATVHLPAGMAVTLLLGYGWERTGGRWVAPDGLHYWSTEEALTVALVAAALQVQS